MAARLRGSTANLPFEDSELVLGLVAPVGTNFEVFENLLECALRTYEYETNRVRLSELIGEFKLPESNRPNCRGSPEYLRIDAAMSQGSKLRFSCRKGDILALAAAAAIAKRRPSADAEKTDRVLHRKAHVLRSLKHPEEVRALRRIYGNGFFLIGIVVSEDERRKHLRDQMRCTDEEITTLIQRDEEEGDPMYIDDRGSNFGQRTRDTFELADAFIRQGNVEEINRFLRLLFAHPYTTPEPDEFAMFMAFSSSTRSGSLSRQVGAVIVSSNGDLLGVGANDVPKAGGGQYWPGPEDRRDHVPRPNAEYGEDSNDRERREIVIDVLTRLMPNGEDKIAWIMSGESKLKASLLQDITEYGRAVHAEMEALLSCARSGVSARDATLYTTTFPCHNCAKHIVSAGVRRVVYVEPYPKSRALRLFDDSIEHKLLVRGHRNEEPWDKVVFEPFLGIGPRRFLDLFSTALSTGTLLERKKDGKTRPWNPKQANPRVAMLPNSYIEREELAGHELAGISAKSTESNS